MKPGQHPRRWPFRVTIHSNLTPDQVEGMAKALGYQAGGEAPHE